MKCLANIKFFAGHFVRRDETPSPDIFKIRRTCPASPANFSYSACQSVCVSVSALPGHSTLVQKMKAMPVCRINT